METLLAGLAFAVFLVAQTAAVVAVQAANNDRQLPAADAIRRDRGDRVAWGSAN
jgi:hypothetical protein